jgi:hypothetical protein
MCSNDVKSARNFVIRINSLVNIRKGDIKQRGCYMNIYVLCMCFTWTQLRLALSTLVLIPKVSPPCSFPGRRTVCYLFRPIESIAVFRASHLVHSVTMFTLLRLMINCSISASFVLKINLVDYYINHLYVTNNLKNAVFWDVPPCRFCVKWCFGGTYRVHLQDRKIRERGTSVSRWQRKFVCS